MNRKYTKEEYLNKVMKAKQEIPGVALSTDVIVGFPGETDEDFEETLNVLRQVEFDQVFMFIYSKRKGTPAAEMEDPYSYEDKHKNFDKLVKLQNDISRKANEAYMGKVVEVLVEGKSKNDSSKYTGRTRTGKVVNFSGADGIVGRLVNVNINEIHSWFLNGEMVIEVK